MSVINAGRRKKSKMRFLFLLLWFGYKASNKKISIPHFPEYPFLVEANWYV
jgi:hypothetical protein